MDHRSRPPESLNRLALRATAHCLSGCAIGEVLGMVVSTALDWPNAASIAISVILAFVFGYALTLLPLLRAGIAFGAACRLAFAADSLSIIIMEAVDTGLMLVIPGAMDTSLATPLFWISLVASLVLAGIAALPVNRWLIARGRGHAVVQEFHRHSG